MKNNQDKIGVVILHYNNLNMTLEYIANLKTLEWGELTHHFIIVDNCSPDKSGDILRAEFEADQDVTVIINSANLGFAKGNDVGINYAYLVRKAELVIVSNNDIKIEDSGLPKKLWNIYQNHPVAVIGPDIYSLEKEIHQSPIRKKPLYEEELQKQIKHINKTICMLRFVQCLHLYDLLSKIKRSIGKKPGIEGVEHEKVQYDVVLHGAFFVLTKFYMEQYPDGLYPETFLYMEEDILSYRCATKNLKTYYTPELSVVHYDGYSTLKRIGNKCEKYIYELKETRRSSQVMLELLKTDQGE